MARFALSLAMAVAFTLVASLTHKTAYAFPPWFRPKPEFEVYETTIGAIQRAIRMRQVTCVEIVERYLQRIEAYNGVCVDQPDGIGSK